MNFKAHGKKSSGNQKLIRKCEIKAVKAATVENHETKVIGFVLFTFHAAAKDFNKRFPMEVFSMLNRKPQERKK
jgi:hypothetical protein